MEVVYALIPTHFFDSGHPEFVTTQKWVADNFVKDHPSYKIMTLPFFGEEKITSFRAIVYKRHDDDVDNEIPVVATTDEEMVASICRKIQQQLGVGWEVFYRVVTLNEFLNYYANKREATLDLKNPFGSSIRELMLKEDKDVNSVQLSLF